MSTVWWAGRSKMMRNVSLKRLQEAFGLDGGCGIWRYDAMLVDYASPPSHYNDYGGFVSSSRVEDHDVSSGEVNGTRDRPKTLKDFVLIASMLPALKAVLGTVALVVVGLSYTLSAILNRPPNFPQPSAEEQAAQEPLTTEASQICVTGYGRGMASAMPSP
ncbi:hypothetical protein CPLU01_15107 [Colletotrichum plurivorum]|uniref:Uncharacterized protein n=1 Tax=Colletotrichum plurivorum TaxID=2175906 RepID=A0A8H6MWB0_9PEZI|nr:hypothetical protein CPLU01_15107 [Colletotrichum plurivorum]